MKRWLLLIIALLLTACGDASAPADVPSAANAGGASGHRSLTRPWLIGSPAELAGQIDEATALAGLSAMRVAAQAPVSVPVAATPARISASVVVPTVVPGSLEPIAPTPTQRRVVLPGRGTPLPTLIPTTAPAALIPAAASADAQAAWAQPITAWIALGMDGVGRARLTPNRAARDLAILASALNDTYFVIDAARVRGLAVSEDAALAATAYRTLLSLYPSNSAAWQRAYGVAVWMGAWRKQDTAQAVANGNQLGALVATSITTRMQDDGSTAPQTFDWPESFIPPGQPVPTARPDRWRPALPDQPVDALWGKVRLIGLASADGLAAAAPPAWDSDAFAATRHAFAATQQGLTAAQRATATKWAGERGTATIAGLWFKVTTALIADARLDARAAAQVYAAVGITLHNAFVLSWADAYRYLIPRPGTWMRTTDAAWSPVVAVLAAPAYPSGEAVACVAVSDVLNAYFPAQAARIAATVAEATEAQIYAGGHWQIDIDAGSDQGHRVGTAMLALIR